MEMDGMRKWMRWATAVAALAVMAGAVTIPRTATGQRAIRYAQRRLGWGVQGRQARVAELAARGLREFQTAYPGDPPDLGQAVYPVKQALMAHRAEAYAAAVTGFEEAGWDQTKAFFWLDLLVSAGGEEAKAYLHNGLQSGELLYRTGFLMAVKAALPEAEIKSLALQLKHQGRNELVRLLGDQAADVAYLKRFLLAQPDQYVDWAVLERSAGWEAALAVYPQLGRSARMSIIRALPNRPGGDEPDWQAWLARETDPAVRQAILLKLNDVPAWLAAIEQDGMFPQPYLHWWEQQVAQEYPDSYLARGILAYEAVRGRPYFEVDWQRWTRNWADWEHGNRFYDPAREIPGWLDFLSRYEKHEAADDAAYRLGRCYEIQGDYASALKWLAAATRLGDQEYAGHARGRIAWILDALLDESGLKALPAEALGPDLQPMIAYSIALRALRAGRYAEAVQRLDAVLARWDGQELALSRSGGWRVYPFWQRVREQKAQAERLARLKEATTPQAGYDIAAAMYHDEFLFYNHLWTGYRQGYVFVAKQALDGDMEPAYARWMAESNNLLQAAAAFDALVDAPAPVAEKAAYSRAMALLQLVNFRWDVPFWLPKTEIEKMGTRALERFLDRFPRSSLVPDALLSLGFLRNDKGLLERVVKEYPRSDAAQTARDPKALEDRPQYRNEDRIPFRYISPAEAPPEVKALLAKDPNGPIWMSLIIGDYAYIVARVGEQNRRVDLHLWDRSDGSSDGFIEVTGQVYNYPKPGFSEVVVRIPAYRRPIRFSPPALQ